MRLSPRKIEYLSLKILKLIQDNRRIHISTHPDLVQRAVYDVIYRNMQEEEEIDAEVDQLIHQHMIEIQAKDVDVSLLRLKIKRELAKKRGFTL